MNKYIKNVQDACISINEQILKDTMSSIKVDIPTIDLDKILVSKNFTFNPFK